MWTNYAYKAPLVCSALACILGNLFYCLSFDLKSLPLLLLARLVTGVGAHCRPCPCPPPAALPSPGSPCQRHVHAQWPGCSKAQRSTRARG